MPSKKTGWSSDEKAIFIRGRDPHNRYRLSLGNGVDNLTVVFFLAVELNVGIPTGFQRCGIVGLLCFMKVIPDNAEHLDDSESLVLTVEFRSIDVPVVRDANAIIHRKSTLVVSFETQ